MYKHVPLYKQHMNDVLMLAGFFLFFKTCKPENGHVIELLEPTRTLLIY